jgi:hypothetical protein
MASPYPIPCLLSLYAYVIATRSSKQGLKKKGWNRMKMPKKKHFQFTHKNSEKTSGKEEGKTSGEKFC